jgi:sugar lactone lactonase YvrE
MMAHNVTRLLDCRNELGESPVWDDAHDRLFWVDINGKAVHALDLADSRHHTWPMPGRVGAIGRCDSGRLIAAIENTVQFLALDTGALTMLATIAFPIRQSRFNDGKIGPDGAFWVGSMDDRADKQPESILYRITADGRVEEKVGGLIIPNGLAFSPDGRTMFHSDSRGAWIDRWDFDPATGAIANRRRIATLTNEDGRPDGGACDIEGNYWSSGISARVLNKFSPDGKLLLKIPVPTLRPTMPCFGGKDMKTIFITSARENLSAEQLAAHPDAGGLFTVTVDVAGAPVAKFADA